MVIAFRCGGADGGPPAAGAPGELGGGALHASTMSTMPRRTALRVAGRRIALCRLRCLAQAYSHRVAAGNPGMTNAERRGQLLSQAKASQPAFWGWVVALTPAT